VVWIVYHDSGPDNNILGIFDNADDAADYAELVGPQYEKGALTSCFPIPWRSTEGGTTIHI
jgi:hypothetical protein